MNGDRVRLASGVALLSCADRGPSLHRRFPARERGKFGFKKISFDSTKQVFIFNHWHFQSTGNVIKQILAELFPFAHVFFNRWVISI